MHIKKKKEGRKKKKKSTRKKLALLIRLHSERSIVNLSFQVITAHGRLVNPSNTPKHRNTYHSFFFMQRSALFIVHTM